MMEYEKLTWFLIGALVILAVVIVFFLLIDKLLKYEPKKAEPQKDDTKTEAPKPVEKTVANSVAEKPNVPVMQIYNSELADDLNELLKNSEKKDNSRIKVESHIVESGNISKYVKEKNYHEFNFNEENPDTAEDEPMTFTREDYKKFMALSNIDQPK